LLLATRKKRKRLRWRFGLYPAEQLSPGISTFFFWSLRERGFERANFLARSW
jgi:hypothetical protein